MKKGDVFTQEYTIGQDIFQGFIDLFHDTSPMHVDDEYAIAHGYTAKIMYGNILNGFISYFVGVVLPIKNVIELHQEIKYYHPIYINETVTLTMIIENVFESVNAIEFKYYFENSKQIKVAKGKLQIGIKQPS